MKLSKPLLTSLLIASIGVVGCKNPTPKNIITNNDNDSVKKKEHKKLEKVLVGLKDSINDDDEDCPACGLG